MLVNIKNAIFNGYVVQSSASALSVSSAGRIISTLLQEEGGLQEGWNALGIALATQCQVEHEDVLWHLLEQLQRAHTAQL